MDEFLTEKCGVVGIQSSDRSYPAARMVHAAQVYLNHRGQDAHGIVSWNGSLSGSTVKMGPVFDDFSSEEYSRLSGSAAIGHNRYRTAGAHGPEYAQPFQGKTFAIAHNGNIANSTLLAEELHRSGVHFRTGYSLTGDFDPQLVSDTEVFEKLISEKPTVLEGIRYASTLVRGSYSLTVLDQDGMLYGVRDPLGMKPLVRARGENTTGIFSETCVLESPDLRMAFDNYIEPGTVFGIGPNGEFTEDLPGKGTRRALDIFELVYFADPVSVIDGLSVSLFREEGGRRLARYAGESDSVVVPVPYSGNSWAQGFSAETRRPMVSWLKRNRHLGRSFISPTDGERSSVARYKFSVIEPNVRKYPNGDIVDDSLVRGTTMKSIISRLDRAGAKRKRLIIGYPEVIDVCHFGIDMRSQDEHIAVQIPDRAERARHLGVDEIHYNTVEDLMAAARAAGTYTFGDIVPTAFCTQCITHNDPFTQ